MLENFLKTVEAEKMTKEEQKNINGGNDTPGMCWSYELGKEVKC